MATPAAAAVAAAAPAKIAVRTGMAAACHSAAAASSGMIAAVWDACQPLRRAALTAATAARRACAAVRVSATRTARPPAALRVSLGGLSGAWCRRSPCRRWAGRCRWTGLTAWTCSATPTTAASAAGIAAAARSPAGKRARTILVTCPAGWGKDAAASIEGIQARGSPAGPVTATTLLAPMSTTKGRPPGLGGDAAAMTDGGTSDATSGSAEPRWTPAARAMASNAVSFSVRSCRSCSAIAARSSSTAMGRKLRRHIGAYPLPTSNQAGQQSLPTPAMTVCKGLCANCIHNCAALRADSPSTNRRSLSVISSTHCAIITTRPSGPNTGALTGHQKRSTNTPGLPGTSTSYR